MALRLPQVALAALFRNMTVVFTATGLIGFALNNIVPCALHIASVAFCSRIWGSAMPHSASATPYSTAAFSPTPVAWGFLLLSTGLTAAAVVTAFA